MPPPRKRTVPRPSDPGRGPAPNARPRKKGRSAKSSKLPQIVAGVTLLITLMGIGTAVYYVADKKLPDAKPTEKPKTVARPSIEPTLRGAVPTRPGHIVHPPDEVYNPGAKDVTKQEFAPAVLGLLQRGVATVFADGKFRPQDPIPRAEFTVWCYNAVMAQSEKSADPFTSQKKAFKQVEATGDEFNDVPIDHWASSVLASCKATGLLEGFVKKSFRPDEPLTREEWSAFAAHLAATTDELEKGTAMDIDMVKFGVAFRKLNFTDYDKVQTPYIPYMFFICKGDKQKNWLLETFPPPINPGPWHPGKAVTRAEAALFIGGFYEDLGKGLM